jgi:hypothetical protein
MPPIGAAASGEVVPESRIGSASATPLFTVQMKLARLFTMSPASLRVPALVVPAILGGVLAGCGGGYNSPAPAPSPSPVSVQVSASSPFSASCGNTAAPGETFTSGSGIQPQIAGIAGGALVGVWEQDRWSGPGPGARGILTAHSSDNGATWSAPQALAFSSCAGGAGPGAGYDRASDPWVTFAGNGVFYASALAFSATGFLASGGLSAVLVSRSADGGATWGTPVAVMADTNGATSPFYFNDRDSITADPANGNVYLVWDRITDAGNLSNPAYLALWTTASATWSTRVLYDPGVGNEAFNNEIVILPSGVVLDFFTLLNFSTSTATLQVVRSTDKGATWSTAPVTVASIQSLATTNPIPSGLLIRDSPNMAQVAVDPNSGAIAAVWQQSFSSTTFNGIALSVSTDGGATWSTPKQVNGVKTAAAFSPTVHYLPNGVLAITYYDLRDYMTGSSVLSTSAWLSESSDGTTWHELRLQSPFDLNKAPLADKGFGTALFLGDNQGLALVGSNALPLYAATTSAGAHVYATQSPNPLTSSSAHVYMAAARGPLAAAAVTQAQATVERMRLRAFSPGRP